MDLLIVDTIDAEVMEWLNARHELLVAPELALDPRAFRNALEDVRAAIVPPSVTLDSQALFNAPFLRVVGRVNAGAENIDLDLCARAGIEVVRSFTASARAEAEFMIGAVLSLLRRVPAEGIESGWVGREIGAATVGLIGMAPAARSVAQMLAGFGSRVVGYDPSVHANDAVWGRCKIEPLGLAELLGQADAVCVQLNSFSRYRGLLGERLLCACKPGQVMVSISHSELFDEAALTMALSSGRIAAAWLDTLEPGALEAHRPLSGAPNLHVTPRLASTTRESRLRSAWAVVKRIDELLTGDSSTAHGFRPTSPGVPLDLADEPQWR